VGGETAGCVIGRFFSQWGKKERVAEGWYRDALVTPTAAPAKKPRRFVTVFVGARVPGFLLLSGGKKQLARRRANGPSRAPSGRNK